MSGGGGAALGGAASGPGGAFAGTYAGGGNAVSSMSGGVGNFVGDLTGSNRMSDAMGRAANAQFAQQQADRTLAMSLAGPSDLEMQQLQQAITLNNQDIARKQKLLDSADPALIEAGHQALALMQGKQAAALGPLQNQRAAQRAALEQNLQKQLGGDYATSTAGIQALNNFDNQTANLSNQVQQQTLAQFMGYTGAAAQLGSQQQNIGNAQSIAQQRGNINNRQLGALFGTPMDPGLQYAGDISRYKSQATYLNQMYQDGRQYGKSWLGQGASKDQGNGIGDGGWADQGGTVAGGAMDQGGGIPFMGGNMVT